MKNVNVMFAAALVCLLALVGFEHHRVSTLQTVPHRPLFGAVTPTDISGVKYPPTAHASTHVGGGSDAIATATNSVDGLLSATRATMVSRCLEDGPRSCTIEFDDFAGGGENSSGSATLITGHTFGKLQWRVLAANAGTVKIVTTGQDANHEGIVQLETVTNATTSAAAIGRFASASPTFTNGSTQHLYDEWDLQVPTASDATNTFTIDVGYAAGMGVAVTDGMVIEYSSAAPASGKLIGRTCASSSCTAVTTSAPTLTAGQWYRVATDYDGSTGTATFYVDGTAIGSTTLTIPSAALAIMAQNIRSAGIASRTVLIDWNYTKRERSTPRG